MMNQEVRARAARWLEMAVAILVFLLPLKFGSMAGMPEVPLLYRGPVIWWIVASWPIVFFSIISVLLLIPTIVFLKPEIDLHKPAVIFLGILSGLSVISCLGWINASTTDYVFSQLSHLFGVASFGFVVFCLLKHRPSFRRYLLAALMISTCITAVLGIRQYFWGFQETLNYVYQQEANSAVKSVSNPLANRLKQTLVFSTFSISNSFAAHLLLTIPVIVAWIWQLLGKVDPPKLSRIVLIPPLAGLLIWTFYLTGSEAAWVALVMAIVLAVVFSRLSLKQSRIFLACFVGLVALGAIGVIAVWFAKSDWVIEIMNRSWPGPKSMRFRFDYFLAALRMFAAHPICGTGWGDFFHDFTQIKAIADPEAPHTPHNLVLAFTSQVGLLGAAAAVLLVVYPLWVAVDRFRPQAGWLIPIDLKSGIVFGWLAWSLHAMADINLQVTGTLATAVMLVLILLVDEAKADQPPEESDERDKSAFAYTRHIWYGMVLVIGLGAAYFSWSVASCEAICSELKEMGSPQGKTREELARIDMAEVERLRQLGTEVAPYSPFPWTMAADIFAFKGDFARAEAYYRKAIEVSPLRASYYHRLSLLQLYQRKIPEALDSLKKARELFPHNPKYYLPKRPDEQRKEGQNDNRRTY